MVGPPAEADLFGSVALTLRPPLTLAGSGAFAIPAPEALGLAQIAVADRDVVNAQSLPGFVVELAKVSAPYGGQPDIAHQTIITWMTIARGMIPSKPEAVTLPVLDA